MMIKLLLIVLCVTFAFTQDEQRVLQELQPKFATSCTTPNRDIGVCVEVQKCAIFVKAIVAGRNESYDFIRESQCGSLNDDSRQPKVCCGIYADYLYKTTTIRPSDRIDIPKRNPFPRICGNHTVTEISDKIYGGDEAKLGQFPWMARLRHRGNGGVFNYGCAGFLISERFVLTAAHCIVSDKLGELGPIYQVQLGEHNTETDPDCEGKPKKCADSPQLLRAGKPIVHLNYSGESEHHNDIALIPLKEPAKLTDYVYPICLSTTISRESQMWLSGWGKTEKKQNSAVKLLVSIFRADWYNCSEMYRLKGVNILGSQFCAGGEAGRDSCTGDSGGPLMVLKNNSIWHAEGIVSVGKGCGEKEWPGIYTSVPYHIPWIVMAAEEYLKQHEEEDNALEVPTPCTTPNNDVGVCVEVQNCSIIVNAIKSGKNESYAFIRESQCEPSNGDARQLKVCCGKHDDYLNKSRITKRVGTSKQSLFPNNCGTQIDDDRILGGTEAQLGQFPWMARLRHRRNDGRFTYGCAGFLITKRFVLTAAHCIRSKVLTPFGPIYQVQLGEHNTQTDPDCTAESGMEDCADEPQLLRAAEPIVHPEYSDDIQYHNDIAVVPLKEDAKFTDFVRPICLSRALSQEPKLWISGWGKTETGNNSHVKLNVIVPRADKAVCVYVYKSNGVTLLNSQFCAGGEEGRDSCSGDSGGPSMVPQNKVGEVIWYAEGIVSFGKGCGLEKWPGVYTSIPYFMPWIETTLNQYLSDHGEEEENADQEEQNNDNVNEPTGFCLTPNGERAHCISIYNCTILQDLLAQNTNSETVRFLRESQCGYDREPQVCCGSVSSYRNVTSRTRRQIKMQDALPDRDVCGLQDLDKLASTELPWLVRLKYKENTSNGTFLCRGTLISSRYVLTTAHCVTGRDIKKIGPLVSVRLGKQACLGLKKCKDIGIDDVIVHPYYHDTFKRRYHDIALIRLDREVLYTKSIKPICLPKPSESITAGDTLWVSSEDRTEYGNFSTGKLKAGVTIMESKHCRNALENAQLCVGGKHKDACNGGTGGPLMSKTKNIPHQWLLNGVLSYSTPCGTKNWYQLYTKLSFYLGWIHDNVRP